MHVLLIDPSFHHDGRLLKFRRIGYFPLTLPRLAACLPETCKITLVHEKCEEIPWGERFDLVFFTTMGPNLARAIELSAQFRSRGTRTVVGGYSVKPFLEYCRGQFDSVVIGDGEGLLPRICEDAAAGRLQPLYENLSPSIESLPPPRWDLVPSRLVGQIVPLEASRGCPNACDFCAISDLYHSRYRRRNPDEVLAEFETVRSVLGRRMYFFTDPNFTADPDHAKTILRRLVGKRIAWLASVDVRCLEDEDFLKLARASGCMSLQVGFESTSVAAVESVNKGFATRTDYGAAIRRAHSFGIPVVALMIVGFDTDTPETFGALRAFAEDNRVPLAVTHPLVPIPGTPLHARLAAEDRLLPLSPAESDGLRVSFRPRNFTPEELTRQYWRFCEELLSLRSIARRFLTLDVLRNPLAWLVLLITNFMARGVVARRLPPGMYE